MAYIETMLGIPNEYDLPTHWSTNTAAHPWYHVTMSHRGWPDLHIQASRIHDLRGASSLCSSVWLVSRYLKQYTMKY